MKRLLAFLITLSIVFTCVSGISLVSFAEDATPISTLEELMAIEAGGNYILTADIIDTPVTTSLFSDGTFTGTFDGDGHTIDLAISNGKGLFASVTGATVKNLRVTGYVNSTNSSVGGVIGYAKNSIVTNCHNEAPVTSKGAYIAGVVGQGIDTHITYCSNQGAITCNNTGNIYSGGVAGYYSVEDATTTDKIIFSNNWNSGDVKVAGVRAGGVLGIVWKKVDKQVEVLNCFNTGLVTTTSTADVSKHFLGSISGYNTKNSGLTVSEGALFKGCYSTTSTASLKDVAYNNAGGVIKNTYTNGLPGVTLETIEKLTETDAVFMDTDVWVTDPSGGYPYPQLVGNLYPKSKTPINLAVNMVDDEYVLTWDCALEGAEYEVYIDGEFAGTTADKSMAIYIEGKTVCEIYVVADLNGERYESDKITASGAYAGGQGTDEDPYQIATAKQFVDTFGEEADDSLFAGHYGLIKDIDLSDADYTPKAGVAFTGSLKGWDPEKGEAVKRRINLGGTKDEPVLRTPVTSLFSTSKTCAGGLINELSGATLSHLVLDGYIKSTANTSQGFGGFVGDSMNNAAYSTITDLDNYATIDAGQSNSAGGIVGSLRGGVSNCQNFGDIIGKMAAGIVGAGINCSLAKVENCYNEGNIQGSHHTGGIIANNYQKVVGCLNAGDVTSSSSGVGGIMGYNSIKGATIDSCVNIGKVKGTGGTKAGGLVGTIYTNGGRPLAISNSYNLGVVSGSALVAAAAGDVYGDTANSIKGFYDLANPELPLYVSSKNVEIAVEDAYIINQNGVTDATIKGLIDAGKFDSAVWEIDLSNGKYNFPTLANNKYDNDLPPYSTANITPVDLAVVKENGVYTLTWSGDTSEVTGYEVYINGEKFGDTVTTQSMDVTNAVKGKSVTIYVKAISAAKESDSEKLEFFDLFPGGSGTEEDPYIIETAENFAAMEQVDAKGVVFSQTAEVIEIDDYYFKTSEDSFKGTYNGNGNTIKVNIKVDEAISTAIGLFGYLSGTVNDLVITGNVEVSNATRAVGAFVGEVVSNSEAVMSKLVNKATIVGPATDSNTGGIVGRAYTTCTITDCINYGTLSGKKLGGITGCTSGKTVIKNCANFGDITGTHAASGIANNSYGSVSYCYNFGTITATVTGAVATGIAGNMTARIVKKDTVSPDGEIIGSTTTYTNPATVEYCFNAGQVVADISCGIAHIITPSTTKDTTDKAGNTIKTYNSAAAVSIKNCYNAVSAKYPVANYDDERIAEVLAKTGEALTHENVYYASPIAEDDNITGTTVVDKEGLKAITLDGFVTEGAYQYPQLADLDIPEEKADVDFILVSISGDLANGSAVEFAEFNSKALYLVKGKDVAVNVAPSFGYGVALTANGADLGEFGAKDTVSVKLENADMVINAAEVELNPSLPENFGTGEEIEISKDPITIGDYEYTRYALVAGRAYQGVALKVKEFGMLITDAELSDDAFVPGAADVRVAKADSEKINEDGWYGILIHGQHIVTGETYYIRPYAIYEDKDGNLEAVYMAAVNSFVMADPSDDILTEE